MTSYQIRRQLRDLKRDQDHNAFAIPQGIGRGKIAKLSKAGEKRLGATIKNCTPSVLSHGVSQWLKFMACHMGFIARGVERLFTATLLPIAGPPTFGIATI